MSPKKDEKTKVKEPELINEIFVNAQGYLKVPDKMRHHFGSPTNYPQPTATVERIGKKIRLTYEFDRKEMEELEGE